MENGLMIHSCISVATERMLGLFVNKSKKDNKFRGRVPFQIGLPNEKPKFCMILTRFEFELASRQQKHAIFCSHLEKHAKTFCSHLDHFFLIQQ